MEQGINKLNMAMTQGRNRMPIITALGTIKLWSQFIAKENHYHSLKSKSLCPPLLIIFIISTNLKATMKRWKK